MWSSRLLFEVPFQKHLSGKDYKRFCNFYAVLLWQLPVSTNFSSIQQIKQINFKPFLSFLQVLRLKNELSVVGLFIILDQIMSRTAYPQVNLNYFKSPFKSTRQDLRHCQQNYLGKAQIILFWPTFLEKNSFCRIKSDFCK